MVKLKHKGSNKFVSENGIDLQFTESVAKMLAEDCWDLEIVYFEEHMMPWFYATGVN